jgi:hypothetical protein
MPKQTKLNPHTLKWFIWRVGKRIYRNHFECCSKCNDVAKNGLVIMDILHAQYLYDTQSDFGAEGIILNYRDRR